MLTKRSLLACSPEPDRARFVIDLAFAQKAYRGAAGGGLLSQTDDATLRGQFYNRWTERLGPVIIAIQRKTGIAGEGHRIANQLCAIGGARICSAGETHSGCGKINRASQIL